ncbi:glucose-6-phosphate isomerase [Candidatus Phytoplasma luffae]|uniref:Glucose-6-phosphate isomerase n=1 Tax=Loofah witches'-broom phytoplasma TaxID=35773 RepID=A0A975FIY6_LOWBP|nr:glucose-6-phosphate isomerase [Candidatus Phytoplasma luffae]QTX02740.1 glucose-6-phosphate isomerase [Candidatus Phytoplasma luffae]
MSLKLNLDGIKTFLDWEKELNIYHSQIKKIHHQLHYDENLKNKYLGWLDLPLNYDREELKRLKELKKQNAYLDVLVVVGIGGSYLGIKAGIELLKAPFSKNKPEIIFAGYQVSGNYLINLLKYLKDKNWAINVISKSGTTLEPALAFRILKDTIEKKYGKKEVQKRIFVTTDKKKGTLFNLAKKEGYQMFVIPDSVGGRFSVLTSVGLLPFAFANLDVDVMLKGALQAFKDNYSDDLLQNQSYQYALARYLMYSKINKKIELLVTYEPCMLAFSEWWKQLFAESEGKEEKGLFVGAVNNSTELHSLGQFIQEGTKMLFETILNVTSIKDDCIVPEINNELDNLNYIAHKSYSQINQKILQATKLAHIEGGVPNLEIIISNLDEFHFGYLVYFFEKACAMSGYLLEINPFNQPGVEIYKHKMFSLLKEKN